VVRSYSGQKHCYRVHISGMTAEDVRHYRSIGGLCVLAASADMAKRVGLAAYRMVCKPRHRVYVVGVDDLGHRGTDGEGCPICAGVAISPDLFTGRA
jgi:hypothetical protein